ncbi:hypothetical protein JKP88DRAFT_267503 [Tribonema minus]|uniref:Uncharacterized protein n=1 Tax=Tribonema minus TaxID=303371 RepID=A0A836CJS7_9STRA|nr:hypothetical protein JKP88DRAFT_267503 [Tribonema minus]
MDEEQESVVSASEMDADGKESETASTARPEDESLQGEIDANYQAIEEINAGTHVEVVEKIKALQGLKRRREEVARAHNEKLLQNARELADFERRAAHATLETALATAKEALLDTIAQEIRRCEEEARKTFSRAEDSRPPLPPPPLHPVNKRAKRPHSKKGGAGRDGGGGRGLGSRRPVTPSVCLPLTDYEMRCDFAAIMADWRERAMEYLKLVGDGQWAHVDAARDSKGQPAVRVDGSLLKVGDRVSVWSRVTDEEFRGELTAVVGDEVFVRLTGNIPTRLHADHLSSGRLKLRRLNR